MSTEVDIDALIGRGRSKRRRRVPVLAAVVLAVGAGAFLFLRSDESDVAPAQPERVEATLGRLSTTVDLSGSAAAERSAALGFEVAGVVASVAVESGQTVEAGEVLALLDDADAQRRIATAEAQVRLALLRLEALLADPAASEIAAARQAIEAAESQVTNAEQALDRVSDPPSAGDLASAEQAVANALGQLSSAEEALARLSGSPGAGDLASAERAVANALGQLSSAEEALARLSGSPGAGDLASAEQAVANALGQLSSAEEALAGLLADPSDTEVASARSAVTAAQAQVASAASGATGSRIALEEAHDDFCDLYHDIDVGETICPSVRPLSDREMTELHESVEGRSRTYRIRANALISANDAFVVAEAARQSAVASLSTAEERLADLLAPASDEDVRQAELAVEAAAASHAAAAARLEELRAPAEQDVYQAERAVEAARASHAAAAARLEELRAPAEQDVYQAERAVEAAAASHAAAAARLDELRAPSDEGDVEQAMASLESARAGLESARARYEELLAGETTNAIAQQEENVRLAEITLEEARADLADRSVVSPFDGVVQAVNVHPGDRVSPNDVALSLSTPDRMLLDLTVTEADLLALEVGQAGLASFDGVEGVEYPVRIVSISRMPDTAQGVVTYDVEARILVGPEVAEVASQIAVLRGGGAGGMTGASGATPGFGAGGGDLGGDVPAGLPAGFELPEGVTMREVIRAVVTGGPLPEGVVLPEDFELPPQVREFVEAARQGGAAGGDRPAARVLPAPGMSAGVTILTELREETLLVPVSAVRQLDGAWFVTIPSGAAETVETGFERVTVEVGQSDGVNVEITAGLEVGAVLLIGADSAGVAFSAVQPQQQTGFGGAGFGSFPPFPGGFGGGGR